MPSFRIRKIKTPVAVPGGLQTREAHEIVNVLIKAFSSGLGGCKPNTPDANVVLGLKCGSTVVGGLVGGEVYVAETTDAVVKIVGCAVWYGPGRESNDTLDEVLASVPYSQKLVSLDLYNEDLMAWLFDVTNLQHASEYKTWFDSALGEGTERKSWNLQMIGVDPEYRRQGVGSLLVKTVLEKAALTNTPLYGECTHETTLKFCKSLGFKPLSVQKGRDESRHEFTNVKGEKFSLWVLFLSDPASWA
ncbi:hypothetical protein C8J57DRAFT_1244168 [Mycena rebaudengoi]|nr:hypothetical protein C8J57DRAFT_1244168 [Mycena rebaudengoi]